MKAVFLDKDGTLIKDKNDAYKIGDVEFFPKTFKSLSILHKKKFKLFLITNQSGIARGLFGKKDMEKLLKFIKKELKDNGIGLEGYSYCPHERKDNCNCRKPRTKMIERFIKKYNILRNKSFLIGDKTSDIEAGKRSKLKTILVMTGKAGSDKEFNTKPDFIAKDIYEAVKIIVEVKK